MSQTQANANVIDLTTEPESPRRRPPRHQNQVIQMPEQEVIELDDDDDDNDDDSENFSPRAENDDEVEVVAPDVELLYSRRRPMTQRAISEYLGRQQNGQTPWYRQNREGSEAVDHGGHNNPPRAPRPRHSALTDLLGAIPQILPFTRTASGTARDLAAVINMDLGRLENFNQHQGRNFNHPDLNFETVAFDLGGNDQPPAAPARPIYTAPSPPVEGFTRSPAEDDVVICPNCDCELGQGDELKRQLWVIKSCGH
ncbi:MAG: hypothetical protein LQ340_005228, partial [Diploschistes diacapsis]